MVDPGAIGATRTDEVPWGRADRKVMPSKALQNCKKTF
jgi:hypothetical protein